MTLESSTNPDLFPLDVGSYRNEHPVTNRLARLAWQFVWVCFFRSTPRPTFGWRRFLLRCFGARIGKGVHVYPSAKIWAPWNLEMGDHSCLGDNTDCYCVDRIKIGAQATVSQYAFLCSAGHDISDPHMKLFTAPIEVGSGAWVCAGAFVGPGTRIGEGAVVAAFSVVVKNVDAWMVVGGNPARVVKKREIRDR